MRKLENILLPRFEGDQRVATLIHYLKNFCYHILGSIPWAKAGADF